MTFLFVGRRCCCMCAAVAGLTPIITMSCQSLTSYRNPPAVQRNWRIFLKKRLETLPITARSFEKDYHINGDNFERSYKETISGFKTWEDAEHAEDWVFCEKQGNRQKFLSYNCIFLLLFMFFNFLFVFLQSSYCKNCNN